MEQTITSIELTPVHVPFKKIVRDAMAAGEGGLGMAIAAEEEWLGGDFVICRLQTAEGTTGTSEVFVWLPETGASPTQIIDVIREYLGRYVLNEDPSNIRKINLRMDNNVARNEVAKGLLDMACYDLVGRFREQPVHELLGGAEIDHVPMAALVPLSTIDSMVAFARTFVEMKYRTLRIKLGRGVKEDEGIMKVIRESVGWDTRFRVDYNQAYAPDVAIKAIRAIEKFKIDYVEQPVRADDYLGMVKVQKQVTVPLMAHEGFFCIRDYITLAELGAVGVLGVNSERPGGLTKAVQAIGIAKTRGMGAVIHNQPLGIGAAMHLHLAAVMHGNLGHDTELFGDVMLEDDLIIRPLPFKRGFVEVPAGPGWGVELDEQALDKYRVGETTVVK
ncbi:MAG: mandelate racemase/muconate lactonizing enzyme family protein [Promethearchaeota archaeon]